MKISLSNFLHHRKAEFEIEDYGAVHITGESGAGKSTILRAIVYALYGKVHGRIRKPYSHGTKTCKVILEYMDLFIQRTSSPNSLIVTHEDVEYEDEGAQSIIDKVMRMSFDEFMSGCYISQKRQHISVLTMTATEQLKFIEILAFPQDTSHSTFHEKVKNNIKKLEDEKNELSKKIDIIDGTVDKIKSKLEEFPKAEDEPPFSVEDINKNIKKLNKRLETINNSLEENNSLLETLRLEEKKNKHTQEKLMKIETEHSHLKTLRDNILDTYTYDDVEAKIKNLDDLKNNLKIQENYQTYLRDLDTYNKFVEDYKKTCVDKRSKINLVSNDVLSEMKAAYSDALSKEKIYMQSKATYDLKLSEKEEARKNISQIFRKIKEKYSVDITKSSEMIVFLNDLRKENCKKYKCPCCDSLLTIDSDKLIKIDLAESRSDSTFGADAECLHSGGNITEEDIKKIDSWISLLKDNSKKLNQKIIEVVKPDVDSSIIHSEIIKAESDKKEYEANNPDVISPSLKKMFSKLENAKKDFEDLPDMSIDDLKNNINAEEKSISSMKDTLMTIESYDKEISLKEIAMKKLTDQTYDPKVESSKEIEQNISSLTKEMMHINECLSEERDRLSIAESYAEYQSKIDEISKEEKNLKRLLSKLTKVDEKLEGFIDLEKTGKEAEIIAVDETLRSLNEHAKIYLDQLFEEPIYVRLESTKELKKGTKLQLNTTIKYRNNDYEHIDELSAGENQKCELAFLLAVNDMLNSPLIMLDECFNNLSADVNMQALEYVKKLCVDKLALVVSHEAIEGIFDNTLHL
jgi:DNA repair exonuclease SbcCD ATPase subunit